MYDSSFSVCLEHIHGDHSDVAWTHCLFMSSVYLKHTTKPVFVYIPAPVYAASKAAFLTDACATYMKKYGNTHTHTHTHTQQTHSHINIHIHTVKMNLPTYFFWAWGLVHHWPFLYWHCSLLHLNTAMFHNQLYISKSILVQSFLAKQQIHNYAVKSKQIIVILF